MTVRARIQVIAEATAEAPIPTEAALAALELFRFRVIDGRGLEYRVASTTATTFGVVAEVDVVDPAAPSWSLIGELGLRDPAGRAAVAFGLETWATDHWRDLAEVRAALTVIRREGWTDPAAIAVPDPRVGAGWVLFGLPVVSSPSWGLVLDLPTASRLREASTTEAGTIARANAEVRDAVAAEDRAVRARRDAVAALDRVRGIIADLCRCEEPWCSEWMIRSELAEVVEGAPTLEVDPDAEALAWQKVEEPLEAALARASAPQADFLPGWETTAAVLALEVTRLRKALEEASA